MPDLHFHRGKEDASGHLARPIEVPWTCKQTGDCCRSFHTVLVTKAEQAVLEQQAIYAPRPVLWERYEQDPKGFVLLKAFPCPFLSDQGTCLVYDQRPYNCRRFMCGRVDVRMESLELGGPMGCWNLSDRIETSLRFEKYYEANERRGQDWARSHGWRRT